MAAAVSTAAALKPIARQFEQKNGIAVIIDGQASSTLAREIELGQDFDVFLSADEAWADYLAKQGHVEKRVDLLSNHLVVVTPRSHPEKIAKLQGLTNPTFKRIAMAAKEVPAGRYAREALERAGLLAQLKDRLIQGGNVRATLMLVERDECDAGFVYSTDAHDSQQVSVALAVPDDLHVPIRYPLVLLRRQDAPDARQWYDYLQTRAAGDIFRKYGFGFLP